MGNTILTEEQIKILQRSRDTYGPNKQIIVSAEECCELSQALLKALRYGDLEERKQKSHRSVLTELADVTIILNHVQSIFDISEEELKAAINAKIQRLEAWLNGSDMIEYTTELRFLEGLKKE